MKILSRLIIVASIFTVVGCEPASPKASVKADISKPVIVDESFDGKEVTLARGQSLVVRLKANATTGYQWKRVAMRTFGQSDSVIKSLGDKYTPAAADKNIVGAGGIYEAEFQGQLQGKVSMTFKYIRPWEGINKNDKSFTIQVSVVE